MIVQAKDYARRADVNVVGTFVSVINDVGANKGVLICSGGFSKSAKTYARKKGILLYSLADAESKDWTAELTIPILWHKLGSDLALGFQFYGEAEWTIKIEGDKLPVFSLDEGTSLYDVVADFESKWNEGSLDLMVGGPHAFAVNEPLWMRILDKDRDEIWQPVKPKISYTVERESWLGYLKPETYLGLIDHLEDGNFIPTRLGLQVPEQRDDSWEKVLDLNKLAVDIKGFFVAAEQVKIDLSAAQWAPVKFHYVGPGLDPTKGN